jgi:hypothetical protein
MKWSSIFTMLIVIIIITGCGIIIIILRGPIVVGPEPICPQCGPLKWLGFTEVLAGFASLFALGKFKNEIKSDRIK